MLPWKRFNSPLSTFHPHGNDCDDRQTPLTKSSSDRMLCFLKLVFLLDRAYVSSRRPLPHPIAKHEWFPHENREEITGMPSMISQASEQFVW